MVRALASGETDLHALLSAILAVTSDYMMQSMHWRFVREVPKPKQMPKICGAKDWDACTVVWMVMESEAPCEHDVPPSHAGYMRAANACHAVCLFAVATFRAMQLEGRPMWTRLACGEAPCRVKDVMLVDGEHVAPRDAPVLNPLLLCCVPGRQRCMTLLDHGKLLRDGRRKRAHAWLMVRLVDDRCFFVDPTAAQLQPGGGAGGPDDVILAWSCDDGGAARPQYVVRNIQVFGDDSACFNLLGQLLTTHGPPLC